MFIVAKPLILSFKNRLRGELDLTSHTSRDVIITGFAIGVMYSIFYGITWTLKQIEAVSILGYISPSQPFSLLFAVLLFMLFTSCLALSFGNFYLADDIDLFLASPTSSTKFFFGKFLTVLFSAVWMPVVFLVPLVVGFGVHYGGSFYYYYLAAVLLLPFVTIPAAIAILAATFFAYVVPGNKKRSFAVLFLSLIALVLYLVFDLIWRFGGASRSTGDILRLMNVFSVSDVLWLPSTWIGNALGDALTGSRKLASDYIILSYSISFVLVSFSFIVVTLYHFGAYSRSRNNRFSTRVGRSVVDVVTGVISVLVNRKRGALIGKDLKLIGRDVSQTVQIAMLVIIASFYLYNLRYFVSVREVIGSSSDAWITFLYGTNILVSAFVITAFSSRFVFPSLSLEGKAMWVLRSAPLSARDIVTAKFFCWFPPVMVLAAIVFSAGALATKGTFFHIGYSLAVSVVLSCGIVGLALGLGALFATFTWEHSSQLSAGFGSFVFMLASLGLIFLTMVPHYFLLLSSSVEFTGEAAIYSLIGIGLLNLSVAIWAIRFGGLVLEKRLEDLPV